MVRCHDRKDIDCIVGFYKGMRKLDETAERGASSVQARVPSLGRGEIGPSGRRVPDIQGWAILG